MPEVPAQVQSGGVSRSSRRRISPNRPRSTRSGGSGDTASGDPDPCGVGNSWFYSASASARGTQAYGCTTAIEQSPATSAAQVR